MGCANYRTLSLIVGWLNVIFSIIAAVMCIYSWISLNHIITKYPEYEEYMGSTIIIYACLIFFSIVWLGLSLLLVKGIREDRHKLMAPWVYGNLVSIVISILSTIYGCFMIFAGNADEQSKVLGPLALIFRAGLQVLFFYPVYKLYHKISNGDRSDIC